MTEFEVERPHAIGIKPAPVKNVSVTPAIPGTPVVLVTGVGTPGPQGLKGDKGDPGDTGPKGDKGDTGPAAPVRRPVRNTIAAVGDSVTAGAGFGGYQPYLNRSYLSQIQLLTHQRIRYGGGNFAVSGTNIAQAQATQLPKVLAMDPLPGACVLAVGGNDVRFPPPTYNFANMKTILKAMVASLLAVGVVPILWCVPPDQYTLDGPPSVFQPNIHQWNTWVRRYAALNGFALIDAFSPLALTDGTYMPGMFQSDNIHPNDKAHGRIARQALADGLAEMFSANSLINTARTTDDLSNLFKSSTLNYGLFTTDSNSDGVADGWTGSTGTATKSLVAPTAADNLRGNWQQVSAAIGQFGLLSVGITSGWSVGDQIALSARIQTQGIETSGALWLFQLIENTPAGYVTPDGSNVTVLAQGTGTWGMDIEDGEIYVEFPVVSQMTDMTIFAGFQSAGKPVSGTAVLRVGEVTIRNLTTGGLLA